MVYIGRIVPGLCWNKRGFRRDRGLAKEGRGESIVGNDFGHKPINVVDLSDLRSFAVAVQCCLRQLEPIAQRVSAQPPLHALPKGEYIAKPPSQLLSRDNPCIHN